MKTVFVCLAIALLFGVSFGWNNFTNSTNPYACYQAKEDIAKAQNEIAAENRRFNTDYRRIESLEADIAQSRNIASYSCTPEEVCADAKKGIVKAKEDIAAENRRFNTDQKVIDKLNQLIAYFKNQIANKCSEADVCASAKSDIKIAREEIAAENRRFNTDQKVIDVLEASITQSMQIISWRCPANDSCAFSKAEILYAREEIDRENRKFNTDQKVIEKLNQMIAYFKDQIASKCSGADVCASAKSDIKTARDEIAAENRRFNTDQKVIARLEASIIQSKQIIAWRCPANDSCAFGQAEILYAREQIAAENRKFNTDARVIAWFQTDVNNSTDLIINTCAPQQACTFIESEISYAEEAIRAENRRFNTDAREIARLEANIRRMKEARFYKCGNNGFMRLAERFARRGGRVLAKLLRH